MLHLGIQNYIMKDLNFMHRFGKPCKNVANISNNVCQLACNERRMLLILPGVYKLEKYFSFRKKKTEKVSKL